MSRLFNPTPFIIAIGIFVFLTSCTTNDSQGFKAQYLGQKPPGMTPEVFAPGIVSTPDGKEFAITFSPDGKEIYFNRGGTILVCRYEGDEWKKAVRAPFDTDYMDHEAHITADGSKLFFGSTRPQPGNKEKRQYGIWMTERKEDGWSEPVYVGFGMAVMTSPNGDIYVTDISGEYGGIVRTRLVDGKFSEFEKLKGEINAFGAAHPCIAPDGSYTLFDSDRPGSYLGENRMDLYVCFKMKDGSWGDAINIGSKLRHGSSDIVSYISPDGKYLFYNGTDGEKWDIYWVDARIIEELKPNELKQRKQ